MAPGTGCRRCSAARHINRTNSRMQAVSSPAVTGSHGQRHPPDGSGRPRPGRLGHQNFRNLGSSGLEKKWLTAGFAEKRKLLEIVSSNFRLDGVTLRTLCYEINKPFDVLAKGLSVPSVGVTRHQLNFFCVLCSEMRMASGLLRIQSDYPAASLQSTEVQPTKA